MIADTITIGEIGKIRADTSSNGNAGDVSVKTKNLDIKTGGQISSSTYGSTYYDNAGVRDSFIGAYHVAGNLVTGNAGNVSIIADKITIDGKGSNISSTTQSNGSGGQITIQGKKIEVLNQGTITTAAFNDVDENITSETDYNPNVALTSTDVIIKADKVSRYSIILYNSEGNQIGNKYDDKYGGEIKNDYTLSKSGKTAFMFTYDINGRIFRYTDFPFFNFFTSAVKDSTSGKTGNISIGANELHIANNGKISIENQVTALDSALVSTGKIIIDWVLIPFNVV